MARKVLLSYMDRNKPICIPDHVEESVSFLKQEFMKNFNFSSNVKLNIVLQKFDEEWDAFVDLEDDAVIAHKEKLKVVVTPLLTDAASLCSAPEDKVDPAVDVSHAKGLCLINI